MPAGRFHGNHSTSACAGEHVSTRCNFAPDSDESICGHVTISFFCGALEVLQHHLRPLTSCKAVKGEASHGGKLVQIPSEAVAELDIRSPVPTQNQPKIRTLQRSSSLFSTL